MHYQRWAKTGDPGEAAPRHQLVVGERKVCNACGQAKPLDELVARATLKAGKRALCLQCNRAYSRSWRVINTERYRASAQAWSAANPEKRRLIARRWAKADNMRRPAAHKSVRLKYKYGLTLAGVEYRLACQRGLCAICNLPLLLDEVHVDHDHRCCPTARSKKTCGKCVRGLVHDRCNRGIACFDDDPALLELAAAYLRRTSKQQMEVATI